MAEPITLYDHIAANNRKTFLLVLLFPLSLCLLVGLACIAGVYVIGDPAFTRDGITVFLTFFPGMHVYLTPGNAPVFGGIGYMLYALLPICIVAMVWMGISYLFGDLMMLRFARAKPIEKKDNPQVFRLVENVAIAAGLPMPEVFVIDDKSLNAFATGRSPKSAAIVLTTGIIARLEPQELEAVIAHEMAHIGNRDIRLNMLIITGLGVFVFFADYLRTFVFYGRSSDKKQSQIMILAFFIMIALLIFNFIVAPLIRLAISRKREYAADATGALIIRNPLALASALEKISQDARVEILDKQPRMAVACVADPREKQVENMNDDLWSTHPNIQSRIWRLRRAAGAVSGSIK